MADIRTSVTQESIRTTTGLQSFVGSLGGATPKACIFMATDSTGVDSGGRAIFTIGVTDGTNSFCVSDFRGKRSSDPLALATQKNSDSSPFSSKNSGEPGSFDIESIFSSFSENTTTINITNQAAARSLEVSAFQFAGDDFIAESGVFTLAATEDGIKTVTLNDSGMTPDIILFFQFRNAVDTASNHSGCSAGIAERDGVSVNNACLYNGERWAFAAIGNIAEVSSTRVGISRNVGMDHYTATMECTDISEGEFEVTTRDDPVQLANQACGYLAMSFGGRSVKSGTFTTPTSSASDWTGPSLGFKPSSVLSFIGTTPTVGTSEYNDYANGISYWAFTSDDEIGGGISRDWLNSDTTLSNNHSQAGLRLFDRDTNADVINLNSPYFHADGWKVDAANITTANVTARQGLYFAIQSDEVAPVITLVGDNPQTVSVGGTYTELGATATDDVDGDVTADIVIDATAVNTSVVGSYSVTYNVTDDAGNAATEVVRTVNVINTAYTATSVFLAGIRTLLTTENTDFFALVGGRVSTSMLPQNSTLPAVVYSLLSWTRETDFDEKIQQARVTVSFDAYAATHAEVVEIIDELDQDLMAAEAIGTLALEEVERLSVQDVSENFGDVFQWRMTADYAFFIRDV